MDTRELECFKAALECGSINKAAKRVFVSPQGLGKMLKKLEAEIGATLFVRTSHGIEPTREALALYDATKRLLEDFEAVKTSIESGGQEQRQGQARVLRPAFSFGVQTLLGIDVFRDFERTHPNVRIDVFEAPDDQVDAALRSGETTFGVTAGPVDTLYYDARFLTSVRHVCIVPESHPLAKHTRISYGDLDGETIILVGRQFKPYHNNMDRLIRADAVPERIVEVGEIHHVGQFASQGVGIGISVEFEAKNNPFPNTVVLPFAEDDCLWSLYIVHPNTHMPDPIEVAFADHLIAHARR